MAAADVQHQPTWKGLKATADAAFKAGHYSRAAESYSEILSGWVDSQAAVDASVKLKVLSNRALAYQKAGNWLLSLEDAHGTLQLDPTYVKGWYSLGRALLEMKFTAEALEALSVALQLDPRNKETREQVKKARAQHREQAYQSTGPYADPELNAQLLSNVKAHLWAATRALLQARSPEAEAEASADSNGARSPKAGRRSSGGAPNLQQQTPEPMACSPPATPQESPRAERPAEGNGVESSNGMPGSHRSSSSGATHFAEDTGSAAAATPMDGLKSDAELAEEQKQRGTACYKAGDWKGAWEAYGAAVRLVPNSSVYWGNRAAAALMLKRFKDAAEDSQHATKLDPGYVRGYSRTAKAFLCMGKMDQAEENYKSALEVDSQDIGTQEAVKSLRSVRSHMRAGEKALEEGDARTALWHADSALREVSPPVETAQMLKVRALSMLGRHSEALSESRSLSVEGDPTASDVLAMRAGALYQAGNMQMAERVYQEALRKDPDSAALRKGIKRLRSLNSAKEAGNEAFKQGRWKDAHGHYSAALEIDPQLRSSFMAQCSCNRAAANSKLGKHADALADAQTALDCDPDFVKAYLRRATAHSALGDHESAVRDYEKVKSIAPETPQISQLLRQAKLDLKKAKRVDYYKILDVDPLASQDEVKKAYRKMALKLHPDKVQDTDRVHAEARFKQLTAAYSLLSDPAKRQKFDAGWSEEEIEQGGMDGGFGGFGGGGYGPSHDDIYEQLFGMRGGGGGFPRGHSHTYSHF